VNSCYFFKKYKYVGIVHNSMRVGCLLELITTLECSLPLYFNLRRGMNLRFGLFTLMLLMVAVGSSLKADASANTAALLTED
jgi:hypothetical protein